MKKWGSEALSNAPPRETWIFQYGSRRITISQASALKPQAAREVAAQYYAKWLQGIDPQVEKEQAAAKAEEAAKRAAETFGTLAAKYLEKQKTELRRSSFAAQRRYLEKHCASLHRLAIDDIDRAAVIALLNTVEKQRGPASRNRCRAVLSAVFSWGMRHWEGRCVQNPIALYTEKREEKTREHVLSDADLRRVWDALPPNEYGVIVKLLALTGQRLSEIARLRWSEVDFDKNLIRLPGDRTKNAKPHELPMSPTVRSLLASVPHNGRETLFPAQAYGLKKRLLDAAITEANGKPIAPWVHHDLRRTAVTGMVSIGILPHVVEAVVNHVSGHRAGVAGIYNRAAYSTEKADALARWDQHLSALTA